MNNERQSVVLVVDDEKNIRESVKIVLAQDNVHVLAAHDAASALRILHETIIDAVILDIRLGDINGLEFFKQFRANGSHTPTIFISGQATLTEAAQATRIGAFDFLEKPFSADKLSVTVKRCLEYASLSERLRITEGQMDTTGLVGDSQVMRSLIAAALRVAPTQASVLIQGESGTGKELIASTIHAHSNRKLMPIVKVNCSAIPESLIESELFGHEKGAFTGAVMSKKGLFETAHRGTIFLDEVADLSLVAQAKILRVLQNGDIQKIGSEHSLKVDVRVISATHKDLRQCIREGLFREDLYFRLNVVPLIAPSLRERPDDIPLLTRFLVRSLCIKHNIVEKSVDDEVLWELKRYAWPGNVRELQNIVERMLIMSGERITLENLPDDLTRTSASGDSSTEHSSLSVYRDQAEREFIIASLKRHRGNITQAATDLGIGRTYLHRRLALLGISKGDYFTA